MISLLERPWNLSVCIEDGKVKLNTTLFGPSQTKNQMVATLVSAKSFLWHFGAQAYFWTCRNMYRPGVSNPKLHNRTDVMYQIMLRDMAQQMRHWAWKCVWRSGFQFEIERLFSGIEGGWCVHWRWYGWLPKWFLLRFLM